jgi:hypothetical protein
MKLQFDDVPHWNFLITEKSAGMYLVEARDEDGRQFELKGSEAEYDGMMKRARETAIAMNREPVQVPRWWERFKRALRKNVF